MTETQPLDLSLPTMMTTLNGLLKKSIAKG